MITAETEFESQILHVYLGAIYLLRPEVKRMQPESSLAKSDKFDPQQIADLHDQFYSVVYRYVRFRLDDPQACEDITSEVFLNLIDAVHKRNQSIHNVKSWLLGTASNLINDYLRNSYKRPTENLDEKEIPYEHTPEEATELSWQKQAVRAAITRLTIEQQNVLALRFSEERSIEETAKLMGKTIGAVKTLQFRALTALKDLLDGRRKR